MKNLRIIWDYTGESFEGEGISLQSLDRGDRTIGDYVNMVNVYKNQVKIGVKTWAEELIRNEIFTYCVGTPNLKIALNDVLDRDNLIELYHEMSHDFNKDDVRMVWRFLLKTKCLKNVFAKFLVCFDRYNFKTITYDMILLPELYSISDFRPFFSDVGGDNEFCDTILKNKGALIRLNL